MLFEGRLMFEVRERTVRGLFQAQQPTLQGQLRLDVSSGCYPADPEQPLDVLSARVAIGERVVFMLHGCAIDATLPETHREGFQLNALPPRPDSLNRLLILHNQNEFEPFVVYRLDRIFGLDSSSRYYHPALRCLAEDLYGWGQTAEAAEEGFVADTANACLFIRCKEPSAALPALESADEVWRPSIRS
jgi:hypothetical protein